MRVFYFWFSHLKLFCMSLKVMQWLILFFMIFLCLKTWFVVSMGHFLYIYIYFVHFNDIIYFDASRLLWIKSGLSSTFTWRCVEHCVHCIIFKWFAPILNAICFLQIFSLQRYARHSLLCKKLSKIECQFCFLSQEESTVLRSNVCPHLGGRFIIYIFITSWRQVHSITFAKNNGISHDLKSELHCFVCLLQLYAVGGWPGGILTNKTQLYGNKSKFSNMTAKGFYPAAAFMVFF